MKEVIDLSGEYNVDFDLVRDAQNRNISFLAYAHDIRWFRNSVGFSIWIESAFSYLSNLMVACIKNKNKTFFFKDQEPRK